MVRTEKRAALRVLRIVAAVVAALVLVGVTGEVLRRSINAGNTDALVVTQERAGVVYLHPMVALVGQLVQTQSAAVRGGTVDTAAVRKRLDGVGTADRKVGALLSASQRYTDLRAQTETALAQAPTGRTAFNEYTDVIALAVALARRVGDTSHLVHDQDLDSYYVMDAALNQLFDAMVSAGRAADLAVLSGTNQLNGDDAIRAAVARYGAATAGEAITTALNKAVDATANSALGTNIAPQLDAFRAAVAAFAPPTMLSQLAGPVDATSLAASAQQVFATAVPLAHKLLFQLDDLLAARQRGIAADLRFLRYCGGAAGLAGLVLLLLAVLRRRRPAPAAAEHRDGTDTSAPVPSLSSLLAGRAPTAGALLSGDPAPGTRSLAPVGHSARSRPAGSGDAR